MAQTRKSKSRVDAARELIAQPVERAQAGLEIAVASRRLGTKVIELQDISKSYDEKVLIKDFSYILKRNDRIGIIGPNGSGKTTLVEIAAGLIKPAAISTSVVFPDPFGPMIPIRSFRFRM